MFIVWNVVLCGLLRLRNAAVTQHRFLLRYLVRTDLDCGMPGRENDVGTRCAT